MLHVVGDGAIAAVLDALPGHRRRPAGCSCGRGSSTPTCCRPADFARAARMAASSLVQNPSHFMIAPVLQQRLGAERVARTDLVKARSPPACRSRSAPTAR